jgi:hypothetical protein
VTEIANDLRQRILSLAPKRVGIPYRLDPPPDGVTTLDCSLYVLQTFQDAEIPFSPGVRTAEQIRQDCDPIEWSDVKPGDLVFFEHTYEPSGAPGPDGRIASHLGISLGAGTGRMWDCRESTSPARPSGPGETDISTQYWQDRIFEARRPRGLSASAAPQSYRITDDGVRLREGPGTSQPILIPDLGAGTIVQGTGRPEVDADGFQWREVRLADGTIGWVATAYLSVVGSSGTSGSSGEIPGDADHRFSFAELWPYIDTASQSYGADARVVAAIMAQESGFTNWRVHRDGTGHGLFGLDDNGLLPDFEAWSGLSCGRGEFAISIPPGLQIEFAAKTIAAFTTRFGSAMNAARVWHRGPGLWQDGLGDRYQALIEGHIANLFG